MIQFVNELNFAELSEAEKELIFSKEMNINTIGRTLKKNVQKFMDLNRERNYSQNENKAVQPQMIPNRQNIPRAQIIPYKHSFALLNLTLSENSNFNIKKIQDIQKTLDTKREEKKKQQQIEMGLKGKGKLKGRKNKSDIEFSEDDSSSEEEALEKNS